MVVTRDLKTNRKVMVEWPCVRNHHDQEGSKDRQCSRVRNEGSDTHDPAVRFL